MLLNSCWRVCRVRRDDDGHASSNVLGLPKRTPAWKSPTVLCSLIWSLKIHTLFMRHKCIINVWRLGTHTLPGTAYTEPPPRPVLVTASKPQCRAYFHFVSNFNPVCSNHLTASMSVQRSHRRPPPERTVFGHSFVTLSGPSHIHTCQRITSPTCSTEALTAAQDKTSPTWSTEALTAAEAIQRTSHLTRKVDTRLADSIVSHEWLVWPL